MGELRVILNTGAEAVLEEGVVEAFRAACAVHCCAPAMPVTMQPARSGMA